MKRIKRGSKYFTPQTEDKNKLCDHENCKEKGEYRAPKDRNLKEYYWFCLKHVQEYNARWNYYDGISTDAPEDEFTMHFKNFGSKVKFDFMGDFDNYQNDFSFLYTQEELKYFKIMDIKPSEANIKLIKDQYKVLVKKYHPDVNQGDKDMEEKFKQLTVAYSHLLAKFS